MEITIKVKDVSGEKYLALREKVFDLKDTSGYGVSVSHIIPVNLMFEHSDGRVFTVSEKEIAMAIIQACE